MISPSILRSRRIWQGQHGYLWRRLFTTLEWRFNKNLILVALSKHVSPASHAKGQTCWHEQSSEVIMIYETTKQSIKSIYSLFWDCIYTEYLESFCRVTVRKVFWFTTIHKVEHRRLSCDMVKWRVYKTRDWVQDSLNLNVTNINTSRDVESQLLSEV